MAPAVETGSPTQEEDEPAAKRAKTEAAAEAAAKAAAEAQQTARQVQSTVNDMTWEVRKADAKRWLETHRLHLAVVCLLLAAVTLWVATTRGAAVQEVAVVELLKPHQRVVKRIVELARGAVLRIKAPKA